ncbi:hypothetical protein CRG98_004225 [Punica granatum]|uniref:Uncharacterized protein n=1 Tax=Punica granatum TaxID=22663 RepID=A0A2I0L5I6_PUNGR|nr:hypothetical protein CRG98_004225 [Punica granatum]
MMHGRAHPAHLQEARVSGLGELAKLKRMHRRAGPADLQEERVSGLGELGNRKRKDAWTSRLGRFARSTCERTRRTWEASKKGCRGEQARYNCKKHVCADSANLRSLKERMQGRAGPADLQEARVSGLGELANCKRKDARVALDPLVLTP